MPKGGFRAGAGRPRKDGKPIQRKAVLLKTPEKTETATEKRLNVAAERVAEAIGIRPDGDAEAFLAGVMGNEDVDLRIRMDAAKSLLPFQKKKAGDIGVKEERKEAAKEVSKGRFAPSAPPKLVAVS